jgi:hypothetical protein
MGIALGIEASFPGIFRIGCLLALVGPGLAYADALPPYSVTPCGGSGQVVCSITGAGMTPTAGQLQGLNASAFDATYPGAPADLVFSMMSSNANGFVIGQVSSNSEPYFTSFVFQDGVFFCCNSDDADGNGFLDGINDSNLIVGTDADFGAYLALIDPTLGGVSFYSNLKLTFTDPSFDSIFYAPIPGVAFLEINNEDQILAVAGRQEYMLDPTPEPTSGILLLTALAGCVALRLRSRRRA